MESFFQSIGFGWTFSKALPYVLLLILGIALYLIARKRITFKWSKIVLAVLVIIPVGIYFAMNPIYEGDFTNNYREIPSVSEATNIPEKALTVVAIPHCPYCTESIKKLNKIAERTDVDAIYFKVLTTDTTSLENYRELASDKVKVSNEIAFEDFAPVTEGRYPTFVYREGKSAKAWSNDGFGVRAIDWIEDQISK